MKKRGQLTIFILIAVVVVVVIASMVFLVRDNQGSYVDSEYWRGEAILERVTTLNNYLEDCIDTTTKDSLIFVAFQGGYYKDPQKKYDFGSVFFPYYYDEGQINFPSLKRIELEIGEYVNEKMTECVSRAEIRDLKISYKTPSTNVEISKDNAYFNIDMQIVVESEKNRMTIELSDRTRNYNSSLYEIYELAEYITMTHSEDSEYYCLSCVSDMAKLRDLFVYFFPATLDQKTTGVMIYENRTKISDPYVFIFFNKYSGREESPKLKLY